MAKGVLVDTWHYTHKAVDAPPENVCDDAEAPEFEPKVRERKVEIKVRLIKQTVEAEQAPHTTNSVSFEAECAEPRIRISGTDIEAIRRGVFAELDTAFAVRWESYMLVKVERPWISEGVGSGAQVTWTNVEKGTTLDGTELLREYDRHHTRGGSIFRISPWPGVFTNKNGRVVACIPATKRNEAAMDEFTAKLDHLRKLLADFLSPDKIQATLANLAGVAFLPPPAEKGSTDIDGEAERLN